MRFGFALLSTIFLAKVKCMRRFSMPVLFITPHKDFYITLPYDPAIIIHISMLSSLNGNTYSTILLKMSWNHHYALHINLYVPKNHTLKFLCWNVIHVPVLPWYWKMENIPREHNDVTKTNEADITGITIQAPYLGIKSLPPYDGGTPENFKYRYPMMTSSNGNIFRVTGHLCGEFTGPRWIPHTKASDAELWCFLWSASE